MARRNSTAKLMLHLVGEEGLEPSTFLCHGFTDRYPRRWVTLPLISSLLTCLGHHAAPRMFAVEFYIMELVSSERL